MPDIYETSDGKQFNTNAQASWHQEELDRSSSSRGGSSKPSQSAISRERATDNLNQAVRCANNGEYEKAIELCNNNMSYLYLGSIINMPENVLANAYNTRGHAYRQLGNRDQAIADFKKALDLDYKHEYAKQNLANMGIQYTPNSGGSSSRSPSSSSSSSSSSKGNGFTDFLENIGFEDANYPGLDINLPLSIIISLVITAGITFLASLFLSSVWIVAVVTLALSFISTFLLNKKLLVILSIIAVIGIGLGVYGIVSPSKSTPAAENTQTVNEE
jgi:tetratricopeptide (TPR) repeat protein